MQWGCIINRFLSSPLKQELKKQMEKSWKDYDVKM